MVKKFSKIMEMNTGKRVATINAYVSVVIISIIMTSLLPIENFLRVI